MLSALALCCASLARAADALPQVWLVSTRGAPHCGDLDTKLEDVCYWRMDEECQWSSADTEAFQATDDASVPTVVFIHGNRTDANEAITKAWYVYELIRVQTGDRPFRYVIWSWPAEHVIRPNREDARLKAAYSDVESYYLAQWLDRLKPGTPVSLIGHSFGPRIITGALHLLAGGEVAGRSLPESTAAAWSGGKRNPVRAVLMAAALDADWLAPGHCHGRALSLIDQMLVACSPGDWVLRRYPRLGGRGGPQSMGAIGPCLGDDADKVEVVEVGGVAHNWRRYSSAPDVCCRWAHYTFLDEPPDQP